METNSVIEVQAIIIETVIINILIPLIVIIFGVWLCKWAIANTQKFNQNEQIIEDRRYEQVEQVIEQLKNISNKIHS